MFSCSGTSYDGEWVMDAEKSSASCMSAMSESMEEENSDDNPFGDMVLGMGGMVCGMVAEMFPPFEISGGTLTMEGSECSVTGGVLDCGDGDKSVSISMDGESLVMGLPSSDTNPAMSLYFKRKD